MSDNTEKYAEPIGYCHVCGDHYGAVENEDGIDVCECCDTPFLGEVGV